MPPADGQVIYADKAFDTKANHAWLRARGIRNGIFKKEAHHVQLTAADREQNQKKGLVRRQIERIFAHPKKWQHYRRVRYLGLARNQLKLTLKAVAYNLKRLAGIRSILAVGHLKFNHPSLSLHLHRPVCAAVEKRSGWRLNTVAPVGLINNFGLVGQA